MVLLLLIFVVDWLMYIEDLEDEHPDKGMTFVRSDLLLFDVDSIRSPGNYELAQRLPPITQKEPTIRGKKISVPP